MLSCKNANAILKNILGIIKRLNGRYLPQLFKFELNTSLLGLGKKATKVSQRETTGCIPDLALKKC